MTKIRKRLYIRILFSIYTTSIGPVRIWDGRSRWEAGQKLFIQSIVVPQYILKIDQCNLKPTILISPVFSHTIQEYS